MRKTIVLVYYSWGGCREVSTEGEKNEEQKHKGCWLKHQGTILFQSILYLPHTYVYTYWIMGYNNWI